ncbi:MAG: M42 family metallopeptidase [Spirochaetaceae bacterium]|nr:M42 family metallopeptidase [Spirochaetaceae bacterium]
MIQHIDFNKGLDYALDFAKKLLAIKSPTGYTDAAVDYIEEELKRFGVQYKRTIKGAIYAIIEGERTDLTRVVSAHVDTLGAMVREIKPDGHLRLMNIGGFPMNNIEGENLYVITRTGKIISGTGLPNQASVHAFDDVGKKERSLEAFEMRLDIVTSSKEETKKAGIAVGDFVAFDPRTVETDTGFIKSRFLDDKICVALLMAELKELSTAQAKPAYTTIFFISNYEEVGHGLTSIPENAFELLAVDIGTVGGTQTSNEHAVTIMAKDGSTPYDYTLRKKLEDICIQEKISYETDVMYHYGSDASAFTRTARDIRFGCMGPGVHATHHYERTHKDALLATYKLLHHYLFSD